MKTALRLSNVVENLDECGFANRYIEPIAKIVKTAITISAWANCSVCDILYIIVLIPFLVFNKICESARIPH